MAGGMGSSESGSSRQGKYAHLTAQGDTANVWTGLQHATLMPDVLHNLLVLTWRADSTTRTGDSFIWHCYTQKVAQSNLSDAFAQMILRFENDTVVNTTVHIYGDRETELYCPSRHNEAQVCHSHALHVAPTAAQRQRAQQEHSRSTLDKGHRPGAHAQEGGRDLHDRGHHQTACRYACR